MASIRQPPPAVTTTTQDFEDDRLPTDAEVDDYEREATELSSYDAHIGSSSGLRHRARRRRQLYGTRERKSLVCDRMPLLTPVVKFWNHHIHLTVPHDACRDHLGKLTKCWRL